MHTSSSSGAVLEASWSVSGTSWGHLGGVLGGLGASGRRLGGVLEASWASWGRLGGVLEASWRRLGASWGRLGGEDRKKASEAQLKALKPHFYLDSVTSTLKVHRKTRGERADF